MRSLSAHIGTLLGHLVDAAREFDRGVTWELKEAAKQEAPKLRAVAQRLAALAETIDALPDATREAHAEAVRQCSDKVDRCQAALYTLVHEVSAGHFEGAKPFFKEVFPDPLSRYYASRGTLDHAGQKQHWSTSFSQQRWLGQRSPGFGLKPDELIPRLAVSVAPVGKIPSPMKPDARLNFALFSRGDQRAEAMESVLKRLRDATDPSRATKVADALNTVVEHRILEVEDLKCHNGASHTTPSTHVEPPDDVLQFLSKEFFELINPAQRDDIFARLQGPYGPVPGSAFDQALRAIGWKSMPMRASATSNTASNT